MVKKLSKADQSAIKEAAKKAERCTAAHISIVVASAADNYDDYLLFYGFTLGALVSLGCWCCRIVTDYTTLLAIQISVMVILDAVPYFRDLCIRLIPSSVRHARGNHAAMREYHQLHAHIAPPTPFVLLYVSLADRYVHVVTNPVVHKNIPGNWDAVTRHFAATIKQEGARPACHEALKQIADILAAQFPAKS